MTCVFFQWEVDYLVGVIVFAKTRIVQARVASSNFFRCFVFVREVEISNAKCVIANFELYFGKFFCTRVDNIFNVVVMMFTYQFFIDMPPP